MAMRRRGERGANTFIWPGFVDAMTALLLVLMFVLSIFMIVQFVLSEELVGKDRSLQNLTTELGALTDQLSLAEQEAEFFKGELSSLTGLLSAERDRAASLASALSDEAAAREAADAELSARILEIAALTSSLEQNAAKTDELSALVAALGDERDAATQAAAASAAEVEAALNENVALRAEIASLRDQEAAARASLAETRDASAAELAALRQELGAMLIAVEQAEQRLAEMTARAEESDAVNAELRARLASLSDQQSTAASSAAEAEAEIALLRARVAELTAARDAEAQNVASAADELTAREQALAQLRQRLADAENRERQSALTLGEKIAALELALDQKRAEAEETLLLLAAVEAKRDALQIEAEALAAEKAALTGTDAERLEALALAQAALADERAVSAEGRQAVALLNTQVRQLRNEIGGLRVQLDAADAKDAENQVVIQDLGSRLNKALAQKVGELQRYRSEFFGRMREALGARDDIVIVGDRFVFQSEVLFATGQAEIGAAGQAQLSRLAEAIRDIQGGIPQDVNWLLRIDGHTDRVPISVGRTYRNNWELSQARALSVVEYLTEVEGLPASRFAAAGFGEYQPIDDADTPEAYAKNRRIEMRLTER